MATAVRRTAIEVRSRLADLELTEELLIEALRGGQAARDTCTKNDPPSLPGILAWGRTLRALGERLVPKSWVRTDSDNFSCVLSPTGEYALTVSTGNEGTGDPDANVVTTKYPKGPATQKAVERNRAQLELFPRMMPQRQPVTPDGVRVLTWLLLIRRVGSEVRAELSLPLTVDDAGYVSDWVERIMLPAFTLDTEPTRAPEDLTEQIDVAVVRRS
jgi:hypothetical protein